MHSIVRDEIYRIGYEAIRNACAHSGGDRLNVTLEYVHDLTLQISDNGVGIDPKIAETGKEGHFGLPGMRERAERIGSKFTLVSSPDWGTAITDRSRTCYFPQRSSPLDGACKVPFSSQLYYGLNVFPAIAPTLRERREDIPLLVEYFLHRFAKRAGKRIDKIGKKTLNMVESYDWPGNVRELQNVVERAVIVSESDALDIDERWLRGGRTAAPFAAQPIQRIYRPRTLTMQEKEKEAIGAVLMECKGRVSGPFGAASQLGLPSSTLESKIKALKIDKGRFRQH